MDIARPASVIEEKKKRQRLLIGGAIGVVVLITLGLSQLEPAAPSVERATVWTDTVKRGEMLREVRGLGTLVPEDIRWIPAQSDGRVEKIVIHPGTPVHANSVILELSNPELELQAQQALSELRAAEARYVELKVRLESQRLDQEAAAARVQAEYSQAKMRADADAQLARDGLVADITVKLSQVTARELENRNSVEQKRLAIAGESIAAQLAVQEAAVEQARAQARLLRGQVDALRVKAGLDGILQLVPVEVGARVAPGANLARVAQPDKLKAVVRIPETQAKDVQIGQKAAVDTRNGVIEAKVARIDPSVQNGTVTVDLALVGELPKGARPDLTVDGTIELERLTNVLFVGRPAQGQGESTVGLFRLDPGTSDARRVKVKLGRASVNTVEVVEGLAEGDTVILSDTSAWDSHDRIRLN
ncbi:MAG: HlyD family efflux transporter periplasmic adaptor subunit [Vicinamibacteria bacterium]|jgi:HlyD family secretion protein|nr:HlyD family efflux transporter periplasmic adaptor subunit [Vicinamibacteria bacterium]